MKFSNLFSSCFWLLFPILIWNLLFTSKLTQEQITSDAHSPAWLLAAEGIFRIAALGILPFFLRMKFDTHLGKLGLAIYIVGTLIYFASWIPLMVAPLSSWSQNALGLLAPSLTPWLALLGIALIAASWPYGLVATIFIFFHTWHGIQNLLGMQ